jgi:hypothetical protein
MPGKAKTENGSPEGTSVWTGFDAAGHKLSETNQDQLSEQP